MGGHIHHNWEKSPRRLKMFERERQRAYQWSIDMTLPHLITSSKLKDMSVFKKILSQL